MLNEQVHVKCNFNKINHDSGGHRERRDRIVLLLKV